LLLDIPQILCTSHEVAAEMGDPVTLACEVRASPSATVDWYFGTGNETLDNSTDADSWTVATEVRPQICINILSRYRTSYSRRIISCSHG